MRLAAIDIGTNSVHMIVVQVRADLSFEVIDREKEMVRLGAGGLDGKSLTESAMGAALLALAKFRRIAESHGVDEILAAATSATREAENGGEFLARIAEETGIRPRVISGTEEARLIHLAAVYGVDVMHGPAVVIDIGGGSVEITLGDAEQPDARPQLQDSGVIRLTERFVDVGSARRRATSGRWCSSSTREIEQHAAAIVDRGLRSRHRHVGHDPEPRHDGGAGGARPRARRDPEPARHRPAAAPAAQAGRFARCSSSG